MDITIRHAEPDDYLALHEVYSQPRAVSGTLQLPLPSKEMWRKRLLEKPDNFITLVSAVDGTVVANLGLVMERNLRRRHVAHLGMAVHDRWQGQGVGSAILGEALDLADSWLNLVRVELTAFTDNEPAIRLYEKFGFKREGVLRKYAYRAGSYQDVVAMARLKDS